MGQTQHQPESEHNGLDMVLDELRESGPLYNPRHVVPMWGPEMLVPDFWASMHYYWLSATSIHPGVHRACANLSHNMSNLWHAMHRHPWLSLFGVSFTAYGVCECVYFRAMLLPGLVIWGIRHQDQP